MKQKEILEGYRRRRSRAGEGLSTEKGRAGYVVTHRGLRRRCGRAQRNAGEVAPPSEREWDSKGEIDWGTRG